MPAIRKISPCLWFDDRAEEAARFYTSIFPRSRIVGVTRYGEAGREFHGKKPGSVLTVELELDGQPFTALNGGPQFKFSEAISFQVNCESQAEIDRYWNALGEGAGGKSQPCGWLKDKFGVSWQIVPHELVEMLMSADPAKVERVMQAIFGMQKLELEVLRKAFRG